jgi:hypothetical protein
MFGISGLLQYKGQVNGSPTRAFPAEGLQADPLPPPLNCSLIASYGECRRTLTFRSVVVRRLSCLSPNADFATMSSYADI